MPEVETIKQCRDVSGRVAPVVDRNRCEGKETCVRVCPYNVFEVKEITPQDKASLSLIGKVKTWVHGGKKAYVVNPEDCHACRLCIEACPETALVLRPLAK